jgi:hypothetical protein
VTLTQGRRLLAGTFVISLVIEFTIIFVILLLGAIGTDDVLRIDTQLLSIYSVHFAVIIGFQFKHNKADPEPAVDNVWLAFALVALWNLLIIFRFAEFLIAAADNGRNDTVRSLIDYTDGIARAGSFLVVGVLAFFFAKAKR